MAIWWNPSQGTTLGVEWELQLIDAASKLLRQDAREVITELRALGAAGAQAEDPRRTDAIDRGGGHRGVLHRV